MYKFRKKLQDACRAGDLEEVLRLSEVVAPEASDLVQLCYQGHTQVLDCVIKLYFKEGIVRTTLAQNDWFYFISNNEITPAHLQMFEYLIVQHNFEQVNSCFLEYVRTTRHPNLTQTVNQAIESRDLKKLLSVHIEAQCATPKKGKL